MRYSLPFLLLLVFASCNKVDKEDIAVEESYTLEHREYSPSQESEFGIAKTIIVHEPSEEILPGMLHPQAALFDVYFNIEDSQIEHQNYVSELREFGAYVIYLKDALMLDCLDSDGNAIEGDALDELRAFAEDILVYDTSLLSEEEAVYQQEYKKEVINDLSVDELVNILIMRPTLVLETTEYNTGISATYQYDPLMNLFYTRDQMITTSKGIIISKMNSSQRQNECEIMIFALNKLGIEPIYEVTGDDAFLEGGDLISYPGISFIGCGMRTTKSAIDQLLERDLFGTDKVVVVYDRQFSQAEMHLDTYFNIIDSDLATLSEARLTATEDSEQYVEIDIYSKESGECQLVSESLGFVEYLQEELGMTLIPISESDQARFAGNYLTVSPRKIMAVANQSADFQSKLSDNGVEVVWIELENIIKGYGAAHCMTQVIERQ